jgi:hypothetical protein
VSGLLSLLQEFHRDKLAMLLRHEGNARFIPQYDANNTYQYIINREDVQLSWLVQAIAELGGAAPESAGEAAAEPARDRRPWQEIAADDARDAGAFVVRWQPRVDELTNARQRGMLRVILGETLELKWFFEQAAAGETDLLGRRTDTVGPRVGEVLPTRWIE